jgi:hypothetical protein
VRQSKSIFRLPVSAGFFEGHISLEPRGYGVTPWRLPHYEQGLYPPKDGLIRHAQSPAGVRLRFRTDAPRLGLRVASNPAKRQCDLVADGQLMETIALDAGEEESWWTMQAPTASAHEVWLDQCTVTTVREWLVPEGSSIEPAKDSRTRWVTYGSSISHCVDAHSPARTWPGVASRVCDLNLTRLGYRGNCHLEPMVARLIRDLPAEIITLKVGINVYGSRSLSIRTLKPALIGFVQIIREQHPMTAVAVLSPIASPPRERIPNAVGLTLEINHDGLSILGEDLAQAYLHDKLHPNGDGYEYIGEVVGREVLPALLARGWPTGPAVG